MNLSVAIRHHLGTFALDVGFQSAGRLTALFGPSGCGKTTVINVIAGLVRPQSALIQIDGDVFADTVHETWIAAHKRRIGYVFQDARLLPHLSVQQNLRYGQWFTPKSRRYVEEEAIVDLLGLAPLLSRRPKQLSGGEKQRVAIGRALLQSPRLLLMDEPLASLDEPRKMEVLPYIERLRDDLNIPIVYVSHSVTEVARLATHVVLMAQGRVVEEGPAAGIMPRLALASDDLGREAGALIEMTIKGYDVDSDLTILSSGAGDVRLPGRLPSPTPNVRAYVRATDVMLSTAKPQSLSALNIFEGVVESVTRTQGPSVDVQVRTGTDAITARITDFSARRLGLERGKRVFAIIKAMSVQKPSVNPEAEHRQYP